MECMSPTEAHAFLGAPGYAKVDWQVETGTAVAPDGGKVSSTTAHQSRPPAHGYVVPGSVHEDGTVVMVADQRTGATGVGDVFVAPMPSLRRISLREAGRTASPMTCSGTSSR